MQGQHEQPDRHGLHQSLELAAAAGRNHPAAQHREAQHGDADLADQDHHRHPPRQVAEHGQPDQGGPDEHLVGDRVGQRAEFGDHPVGAGQPTIEPVGDDRDGKDHECGYPACRFMAVTGEQEKQEDRDQDQPDTGEEVGEVGHPHARHHWTAWGLCRHGKQNIGWQSASSRPILCTRDRATR